MLFPALSYADKILLNGTEVVEWLRSSKMQAATNILSHCLFGQSKNSVSLSQLVPGFWFKLYIKLGDLCMQTPQLDLSQYNFPLLQYCANPF